jgi:hypothetical protein
MFAVTIWQFHDQVHIGSAQNQPDVLPFVGSLKQQNSNRRTIR